MNDAADWTKLIVAAALPVLLARIWSMFEHRKATRQIDDIHRIVRNGHTLKRDLAEERNGRR